MRPSFLPVLTALATVAAVAAPTAAEARHLVRHSGAPTALVDKLDAYLTLGKRLDVVAVDPNLRWVVVAEDYRFYSSGSHFDANGLRPAIERARSNGKRLRAVHFDAQGDWLLVGDGVLETNDPTEFGRQALMSQLKARIDVGRTVTAVGRDRATGAWAFVSDGVHYGSGMSAAANDAFGDARLANRPVRDVALAGSRFVVAAHGRTVAGGGSTGLRADLRFVRDQGLDVEKALLLGTSGHLVVATDSAPALTAAQLDADRFERGFTSEVPAGTAPRIEALLERSSVPGAIIARWQDGRVLWARGYGVLEAGTERFTRSDSIFPAASMSKIVAGILGARLHEAGHIDLDQPLMELAGDDDDGPFSRWWNTAIDPWGLSDGAPPAVGTVARQWYDVFAKLTLRMLLRNIGGTSVHGIGQYPLDAQPTLDDVLLGADPYRGEAVTLIHAPGTVWDYSGGGFTVFEAVLEEVLGSNYETLARSWVLDPVGLSRATTTFAPPVGTTLENRAAIGTDRFGASKGELEDCPGEAAGGLVTTASEFVRIIGALRSAATGDAASPFSQGVARMVLGKTLFPTGVGRCVSDADCGGQGSCHATLESFFKVCARLPADNGTSKTYGFGVNLRAEPADAWPRSFEHGGAHDGYRNRFRMQVTGGTNGFVVFTNGPDCEDAGATCTGGGDAIIDAVERVMYQTWAGTP